MAMHETPFPFFAPEDLRHPEFHKGVGVIVRISVGPMLEACKTCNIGSDSSVEILLAIGPPENCDAAYSSRGPTSAQPRSNLPKPPKTVTSSWCE